MLKRKADAGDLVDLLDWSRPKVDATQDHIVRVHEAGHAIAALAVERHGWTLKRVEARASGTSPEGLEMGGHVLAFQPPWTPSREDRLREITCALAGRAAEERVLGRVTAGARDDLRTATRIAASMVRQEGLGSTLTHIASDSPATEAHLSAVEALLAEAYAMSLTLVAGWRVPALAEILVERRSLTGDEVRAALRAWHADRFFAARDDSHSLGQQAEAHGFGPRGGSPPVFP